VNRHVTHFVDSTVYGGAEQVVVNLLPGLVAAGWRVSLVYRDHDGLQPFLDQVTAACPNAKLVPFQRRERLAGVLCLPRLVRIFRELRPDVMHANLPVPFEAGFGVLAGRIARVPRIVGTVHLVADPPTGLRASAKRLIGRLVNQYIAVSDSVAAQVAKLLPVSGRVSVVHNAVQLEPSPRRRTSISRVVLCLARLEEQKGLVDLITAATELPDVEVLIAGNGSLRPVLEAEIEQRALSGRVRLLGYRSDRADLLAECDLLVLSSLNEGLPLSVLEAMAAGLPVVATAVGGVPEAVVHGSTGLLVAPRDPAALAAAIRLILNSPDLATRLGNAGRSRVAERFSCAAMTRGVLAVYTGMFC
jgi:glycosyltransferase involved in cell wall biosynthesis